MLLLVATTVMESPADAIPRIARRVREKTATVVDCILWDGIRESWEVVRENLCLAGGVLDIRRLSTSHV